MKRIEDIMKAPVICTQPKVKVAHLKDMFNRKEVNAVPALKDDGEIAGIVTSSDILSCHDDAMLVKDIMSKPVHIVLKNNRVKDAAKIMVKHGVHHLVVMDNGQVVGIVSSIDIMRVYSEE